MRRPSPLPQSPVASRGTAAEKAAVARALRPADDEAVKVPAGERGAASTEPMEPSPDGNPTAPVVPLAPPTPLPDATSPADRAPEDDAPDPAKVGFREVFTAARARRKALRAEIRRFTVRQRRRRAMWLGAAASVLLLALGTLGAAYSPLFGVERITVVGAQQLAAGDIEAALSSQLGKPLPLVDESAIKAELVSFPLIETYALEARPPHELVVRILERTPIGLIQTRAGYTLVDAAGVALSTSATPNPGTPLLTITGGVDSDAFSAAGQVMRSLPDEIRAQVTEVAASTPDDVTLSLGGTHTQVVWGSAEESARKAVALQRIMTARPPADVTSYDVSSPDAVVVR